MPTEAPKKERIDNTTAWFMLAVAALFDVLSVVPILNFFTTIFGALTFWLWFTLHDVSVGFTSPKRLLTLGGTSIAEIIPAISALPAWTAGVGFMLLMVKSEDTFGSSVPLPGKKRLSGVPHAGPK